MFSPITQRFWKVRVLYYCIYGILLAGTVTMVVPFLIMLTGAIEPLSGVGAEIFPTWLVKNDKFQGRYLAAKYRESNDLLRMAWSNPDVDFNDAIPLNEDRNIDLWKRFIAEEKPSPRLYTAGFLRQNARMPSYTGRAFRTWLLNRYQNSLEALNEDLQERFPKVTAIHAPSLHIVGPTIPETPLIKYFYEFCASLPQEQLIPWDAGGYYRAVYLPRTLGADISVYNEKYGTHYTSYSEVPFPAEAPTEGREDWSFFVSRVLRPDFVMLTEEGEVRRATLGMEREKYIRMHALPEDLRVTSLDVRFASWCAEQGIADARIPQQASDLKAFDEKAGFWKRVLMSANYLYVLDEILLHGRSIYNTTILILLSVAGALLVNPLAAYALSRFRLKQTYFILLFCLATIAFPAEVTMIPVFLQMKELHLLNTFGALVLPTLASGFSIFLLKGFFDSLPKELYEAAEIDGASEWMMFWQIAINLSKPILAVVALGAFTSAYGAYFYALILAPDPKMWTIMVEIYQLRQMVDPPVVYASLILTAIPTFIMFLFCQNLILQGIVVPSEK